MHFYISNVQEQIIIKVTDKNTTINLTQKHLKINGLDASYMELNDSGIPAVFYHANGFTIGTYSEFLKRLTRKFKIYGLPLRACYTDPPPAPKEFEWEDYADDLISFVEQKFDTPAIVIGHSQGATASLMAASKRPELFRQLIVIEPASVSPFAFVLLRIFPYSLKSLVEPMKGALAKKEYWDTKEEFFQYYRSRNAYRRISDKVLRDFADHGLLPTNNGRFRMTFSPQWEAANYARALSPLKYVRQVKIPIHLIAGKPSLFFSEGSRTKWRKISPNSQITENHSFGHLIPLEAPEFCVETILNAIQGD